MQYKCLTCSGNSVFLWRHAKDSLINVFRTRMCGQTLLFIVIANCAIAHRMTSVYFCRQCSYVTHRLYQHYSDQYQQPKQMSSSSFCVTLSSLQTTPGTRAVSILHTQYSPWLAVHRATECSVWSPITVLAGLSVWQLCGAALQTVRPAEKFPFSDLTLWLGDRKDIRSVKRWLLVMMIWLELCMSYSSSCHHSPPPSSLVQ